MAAFGLAVAEETFFCPLLIGQFRLAIRTGLLDRLVVDGELALRIPDATIENIAALAAAPLGQFAFAALRAFDADSVLLDVLALREARAGHERAEASVAPDHFLAALRTFFAGRLRNGRLPFGMDGFRGLAVRVAGAGPELPEPSALDHHFAPAIVADFRVALVVLGNVGKRALIFRFAGIGAVRVAGAGDEQTVAAHAEKHFLAAALAGLPGGLARLVIEHLAVGAVEVHLELAVELFEGVGPAHLAFFNFVEFFFHARGVSGVEDVAEALD